ncbi:MAG: FAD-binding oxidoreductase [Synechococcales cyanobacterium]
MPLFAPATVPELMDWLASQRSHPQPFFPCGAQSKKHWGSLVSDDALWVSTQHWQRVLDYAPTDLTVTVEAGLPLRVLQALLAEQGQWWPVDPLFPDQATVGGIIATADTGSLRHRYGGVRDGVLGVHFVRADGQLAKAGGKVVKNVAGYDLMKLLTGSWGTLAVLTQVTLRLYPLPSQRLTALWLGTAEQVAALSAHVLNSVLTPLTVDGLSPALTDGERWGLQVDFQGLAASEQQQRLAVMAQALDLALDLEAATPLEPDTTPWQEPGVLLKVGIPMAIGIPTLAQLVTDHPAARVQFHGGSGLGRCWLPEISAAQAQDWRSQLEQVGGFLTVLAAPDALKQAVDVWGIPAASRALQARVRQQFDPHNLLSPGRGPV